MKRLLALLLCLLIPTAAFAADNGYKVMYDGGSVPQMKAGETAHLVLDGNKILLFGGKDLLATIPANSVTEISYGQDVHRRVGSAVAVACSRLEPAHSSP